MKYKNIYNRLRRIEGQVRGIEDMLANDKKEEDIIIQLEAVKSSIASSISSLVESSLDQDITGNIVKIEKKKLEAIIKLIKKS